MGMVRYNQRGYVGCSMSINAALAYDNGEKPKSKWSKGAMLDELRWYCTDNGLAFDDSVRKLTKAELWERFFEWSSWHHTGKFANQTDFYWLDENAVCAAFGKETA